jgi:hypothetical protein
MSTHPDKWEIYIPKEDFEKLRSDSRFIALLPLARVVNALKFCFQTMVEHSASDTPSGTRQHINSFLFGCGVLYEGLKIANTLGKHFGEREAFREGFGKLLKSKETKKLNDSVLNPMRNKLVFHFDEDVAPSVLKNLELEQYAFATADGAKSGEVYYNLADEVAINFIIGEPGSHEEEVRIFREALQSVSIVITEYVKSADILIADVLKDMNWRGRERKQSS